MATWCQFKPRRKLDKDAPWREVPPIIPVTRMVETDKYGNVTTLGAVALGSCRKVRMSLAQVKGYYEAADKGELVL